MKFRFINVLLVISVVSGCISMEEIAENEHYPRDTAISIGDQRYVVNTYKCAEIRRINDKGALECYAADGSKSAKVSPEGDFQRQLFDKYIDYEWGSEEHHAFLYDFYYQGGKERLANSLAQTTIAIVEIHQAMNSSSYNQGTSTGGVPLYGTNPALNGMTVWGAREFSLADWHFNNISYFNLGNGRTYTQGGISSQTIGNLTFHSNGVKSYHFGDSIYHSNGTTSISVSDSLTYTNDGTHCLSVTSNIVQCRK